MESTTLYQQILGIGHPWVVERVEVNEGENEIRVEVGLASGAKLSCPDCGRACSRYDRRRRKWRHLDTCQYKTIVEASVPRVQCGAHGVRQASVPWAEANSRFTALFEIETIDWLKEASVSAVARQRTLSWDEVWGLLMRAVQRGLARRKLEPPERIGVDETSVGRGQDYLTIVHDIDRNRVLSVGDDRGRASLDGYYEKLSSEEKSGIQAVAMDMHEPYVRSTEDHVPRAREKICFDKFHIAQHLSEAVDRVRREEHRHLQATGDDRLSGTRYLWLRHPANIEEAPWRAFEPLRNSSLRTARAWALREMAMGLWHYSARGWAWRGWQRWLSWATRCRLEPVKRVGQTIKSHLDGIINAVVLKVTNARAESYNATIQEIKRRARGFRNRERFKAAIYFHLGRLQLYPEVSSV